MAIGNEQRAERGAELARTYLGLTGDRLAYGIRHWPVGAAAGLVAVLASAEDTEPEVLAADALDEARTVLGDLLADVLHFAAVCGVDADALYGVASMHFLAEQRGEL